jgi:hypothetical protein
MGSGRRGNGGGRKRGNWSGRDGDGKNVTAHDQTVSKEKGEVLKKSVWRRGRKER